MPRAETARAADGGLADVGRFAPDFHGEYHLRSDLDYDHVIGLMDVRLLAAAFLTDCY